jgi:tetratricopeptide (TPR) repeat protein
MATRRAALATIAALATTAALPLLPCTARAAPSDEGDDQALLRDADFAAGRAAVKASDFKLALQRFQSALRRFPDAADLHNELGFSHRKLRQFDKAFEHYKRALAIKPDHRGAHEYIGEAYLMVNDVASAQKHLDALRSICLLPCEELQDLQKAIAEHQARGNPR